MKTLINFLSKLSGLFRSVITILFLLATIFTGFADKKSLASLLDIINFNNVPLNFIKPFAIFALLLIFIFNFIVTRNIFRQASTGERAIVNLFFGLLFIAIDIFIYVFILRERLIFLLMLLNALVVISAIFTIIGRSKGVFEDYSESPKEVEINKAEESYQAPYTPSKPASYRKIDAEPVNLNFVNPDPQDDLYTESENSEDTESPYIEEGNKEDLDKDDLPTDATSEEIPSEVEGD
ncbi:hypothetical protein [Anaerococcus sp. AGMB09787]|uniref:hypothetical protein n=1 Tax=Anaerococcus sp. AGMB09787 TaxID=2922869 RepID=UPI001FAFAA12|nr:hypothetical protein [Anaerococcus sp. AGMB09787]